MPAERARASRCHSPQRPRCVYGETHPYAPTPNADGRGRGPLGAKPATPPNGEHTRDCTPQRNARVSPPPKVSLPLPGLRHPKEGVLRLSGFPPFGWRGTFGKKTLSLPREGTTMSKRLGAALGALLTFATVLAVVPLVNAEPADAHTKTRERCSFDPIAGRQCWRENVPHTHPVKLPPKECVPDMPLHTARPDGVARNPDAQGAEPEQAQPAEQPEQQGSAATNCDVRGVITQPTPSTTAPPPTTAAPKCPAGSSGTPPNCVADVCPAGQTGTPPNCVAEVCPSGTSGTPPNCVKEPICTPWPSCADKGETGPDTTEGPPTPTTVPNIGHCRVKDGQTIADGKLKDKDGTVLGTCTSFICTGNSHIHGAPFKGTSSRGDVTGVSGACHPRAQDHCSAGFHDHSQVGDHSEHPAVPAENRSLWTGEIKHGTCHPVNDRHRCLSGNHDHDGIGCHSKTVDKCPTGQHEHTAAGVFPRVRGCHDLNAQHNSGDLTLTAEIVHTATGAVLCTAVGSAASKAVQLVQKGASWVRKFITGAGASEGAQWGCDKLYDALIHEEARQHEADKKKDHNEHAEEKAEQDGTDTTPDGTDTTPEPETNEPTTPAECTYYYASARLCMWWENHVLQRKTFPSP